MADVTTERIDKTPRIETLTSACLGQSKSDELLARVRDADAVYFDITTAFSVDTLESIQLVCALSRRSRRIVRRIGSVGFTGGLKDATELSLLGPLLWKSSELVSFESSTDALSPPAHADSKRKLFCVSTELLDCKTREAFHAGLGLWMIRAGISIDSSLFERLTMLAYEPATNAEEHGSTRLIENNALDPRSVFRCVATRFHSSVDGLGLPEASDYISEFGSQHDVHSTRWLEVIVADAGMGIAYPAYQSWAQRMGSSSTNVYAVDFDAERGKLDEVLNKGLSTKGQWGQVKSASSDSGKGMKLIRRNVARLRGFGAVRAGRCSATLACPEAKISEVEIGTREFTLNKEEHPLFLGTAWYFLLPLDLQLQFPV